MSSPPPPPPRPHDYSAPVQDSAVSDGVSPAATDVAPLDDTGNWLPQVLEHTSKPDLAALLADSTLLSALVSAAVTAHPAVPASRVPVDTALDANMVLARQTDEGERRLTHRRHAIQTQLVATHALERQWRQKQSEMDRALAPAAPSSLYQRLAHGVHEQELVCRALEDSFLDSDNAATASEREVTDWVRRYRDAKKVYYARRESKARWDEGRVGGWR